MTVLKDKTVLITGASSGIGAACAEAFAQNGAHLVLAARRKQKLDGISQDLRDRFHINILNLELDVRNLNEVEKTFSSLSGQWENIDILVNNAGLSRGFDPLYEGQYIDWEEMIDTNIKGLLYVSRNIIPGMIIRGKGDIINVGSIAGHEVYPRGNVYCATKHAVDALTKGLRLDLLGTPLRVSTVDPGLVETEFSSVRFRGDNERAKQVYQGFKALTAQDIADCILYCASRPAHVQIAEIVVLPTAQRSATTVHKTQ